VSGAHVGQRRAHRQLRQQPRRHLRDRPRHARCDDHAGRTHPRSRTCTSSYIDDVDWVGYRRQFPGSAQPRCSLCSWRRFYKDRPRAGRGQRPLTTASCSRATARSIRRLNEIFLITNSGWNWRYDYSSLAIPGHQADGVAADDRQLTCARGARSTARGNRTTRGLHPARMRSERQGLGSAHRTQQQPDGQRPTTLSATPAGRITLAA